MDAYSLAPEKLPMRRSRHRVWVARIGLLSYFSLITGQSALAQSEISIEVTPDSPGLEAAPLLKAAPAEVSAPAIAAPVPVASPAPVAAPAAPAAPVFAEPAAPPAPTAATPTPASNSPVANPQNSTIPAPNVVTPSQIVPAAIPTAEQSAANYGTVFIDPTDYSLGATPSPNGGPNVVLAERSSGCELTLAPGQTPTTQVCQRTSATTAGAGNLGRNGERLTANAPTLNIGPISISSAGVRVSGNTTLAGRTFYSRNDYNRLARPLVSLQMGERFIFPLTIPAPITSLFGWRVHPIFGEQRFHSGTDLGAPLGTPVLATQAGQVAVSDFLGGYGMTVVLRHDNDTLESRYAHLSQLLVQPGEWVEKGEVIGLVGSTGNSTGPHLHFELRQLTADGWVAVSPNEVMQYALANLVQTLNNPLLAFNLQVASPQPTFTPGLNPGNADQVGPHLPLAFRPAQPNAN